MYSLYSLNCYKIILTINWSITHYRNHSSTVLAIKAIKAINPQKCKTTVHFLPKRKLSLSDSAVDCERSDLESPVDWASAHKVKGYRSGERTVRCWYWWGCILITSSSILNKTLNRAARDKRTCNPTPRMRIHRSLTVPEMHFIQKQKMITNYS